MDKRGKSKERGTPALCGVHIAEGEINVVKRNFRVEVDLKCKCTEKVLSYLETLLGDTENYEIAPEISTTMQSLCYVISCINQASESIGKDGRFQLFICIGVRY